LRKRERGPQRALLLELLLKLFEGKLALQAAKNIFRKRRAEQE